ncbi:3'(2'),5'-bisphosphate nucleotidase CysQ [Rhizobium oryzicola]|uniref:3'(2'),5'-bisphosphate nucleotidase CysQ n=1 Tax=Rhizobium oryzicola TaxID=1232668 RepID=A0ABT8SR28_9HYPH|nr:3'(2'),5'-bisphosphate nucleotidase CysQ [Rhizobium oryzicola]MDO1580869.1 3'(2'),5'-bisphosphate nucleotidase CysQ [Rhizobium oryzicola]
MLDLFEKAALEAGRIIMDLYRRGCTIETKADDTPVTEADRLAEEAILSILLPHLGDIPVIAEEQAAAGIVPQTNGHPFLLIDPLDGTREFIKRNGEFTVNIALIEEGIPTAGVVYAPALGVAYLGDRQGALKLLIDEDHRITSGAAIHARSLLDPPVALASRSHGDAETTAFLDEIGVNDCRTIGSSLKFCLVAEGVADVYPRFGRTMEWDTAAGDAVLRAAGGSTVLPDGSPLTYGKRGRSDAIDFANPAFIAWGRR